MLFPTLEPSSYLLWWPSLTKDVQTEQQASLEEWYDRHRKYSTTSIVQTKKKISIGWWKILIG